MSILIPHHDVREIVILILLMNSSVKMYNDFVLLFDEREEKR